MFSIQLVLRTVSNARTPEQGPSAFTTSAPQATSSNLRTALAMVRSLHHRFCDSVICFQKFHLNDITRQQLQLVSCFTTSFIFSSLPLKLLGVFLRHLEFWNDDLCSMQPEVPPQHRLTLMPWYLFLGVLYFS